jgi:hypothetical protein
MAGEKAVIIEVDLDVGRHDHRGGELEITANGDVTRYVNRTANGPTTSFFDRMPKSIAPATFWAST